MENNNPNMNQNSKDNSEKLHKKIKETYTKLNDEDIKFYDGKRDQFYAKLQEKHNVSKEDARRKLEQIEKDCGYTTTAKSA